MAAEQVQAGWVYMRPSLNLPLEQPVDVGLRGGHARARQAGARALALSNQPVIRLLALAALALAPSPPSLGVGFELLPRLRLREASSDGASRFERAVAADTVCLLLFTSPAFVADETVAGAEVEAGARFLKLWCCKSS